jgi:hypothetical protein
MIEPARMVVMKIALLGPRRQATAPVVVLLMYVSSTRPHVPLFLLCNKQNDVRYHFMVCLEKRHVNPVRCYKNTWFLAFLVAQTLICCVTATEKQQNWAFLDTLGNTTSLCR